MNTDNTLSRWMKGIFNMFGPRRQAKPPSATPSALVRSSYGKSLYAKGASPATLIQRRQRKARRIQRRYAK